MATIYRALVTTILLLLAWVVVTGARAGNGEEALALHLRAGLVAALAGCLVNSVPFAYFIGTRFWVKAFVRAARAPDDWNRRHDAWMKGRAYPFMYAAAFAPAAVAITGVLVETGRAAAWWHPTFVVVALVTQVAALLLTPNMMKRNAALMDELADTHQVPRPDTPEMDELVREEEASALPPLFQLSRVLLLVGSNLVILWLYLRFGTEDWRGAPFAPFGLGACVLVALGLGLNGRFDPDAPLPPTQAWGRAIAVGGLGVALTLWITWS